MPSNQMDANGIPKYDEDEKKPCKTCGVRECERVGDGGMIAGPKRCWRPRIRRPSDMCCMLGKFSKGGMCHGSRCYLWSIDAPTDERGIPGTCIIAQLLAQMCDAGARYGVAYEEGEGS